jgi:tetrahydromethanopterin S-methyltransferase subunit A
MEPIAYDCIGCKKCWGADTTIRLTEHFENIEPDACGSNGCTADAPVNRAIDAAKETWPPYPGDYVVGNPVGSVAICTLSNRDLPARIIKQGEPHIAIAGRCDTENIGIEKVVLNILANFHIRWLILTGMEAPGHRAGDARPNGRASRFQYLLSQAENGAEEDDGGLEI